MASATTRSVRLPCRAAKPAVATAATVRTSVMTFAGVPRRSWVGSAYTSRAASASVAIAGDDVLRRGHLRQAHRPPGVKLLCGDADLRPEPELSPVGEPGRGVDEDRGGVDGGGEAPCRRLRPGHDGVAVAGRVAPDVCNGRVEVGYDGRRDVEGEVLLAE